MPQTQSLIMCFIEKLFDIRLLWRDEEICPCNGVGSNIYVLAVCCKMGQWTPPFFLVLKKSTRIYPVNMVPFGGFVKLLRPLTNKYFVKWAYQDLWLLTTNRVYHLNLPFWLLIVWRAWGQEAIDTASLKEGSLPLFLLLPQPSA